MTAKGVYIFCDDQLSDLFGLSAEEVGAYWLLLLSQMKCRRLPNNMKRLQRMTNLDSMKKLKEVWEAISCKFDEDADGYFSSWLDAELQKREDYHQQQRTRGRAGAAARWKSNGRGNDNGHATGHGDCHATEHGDSSGKGHDGAHSDRMTTSTPTSTSSSKVH